MRLDNTFFENKDTLTLAQDLLWKVITKITPEGVISGIISEVEAYNQDDPASHCYGGKTQRNQSMFLSAGHMYVYFTYGMHFCCNIVSGEAGYGSGVLLRAIFPYEWRERMIQNRNYTQKNLKNLTNGPAKLTQALWIGKNFDGINLLDTNVPIYLEDMWYEVWKIYSWPRIGISKAIEKPWRFWIEEKNT